MSRAANAADALLERWDRRRVLWILGAVTVALFVVLTIIDGRLRDTGGPGIVSFELAGSTERATEILGHWGIDGRDTAQLSLWLDYLFLIAYGLFFAYAVLVMRATAAARGWHRFAAIGLPIAVLPLIAAVFDAGEDANLLYVLAGHASSPAPRLATALALVKFVTIAGAELYLLCGLAALGVRRITRESA